MLVAVPRPALDRIGIGNNSIEDRKRTLNHSTEAVPPGQRFCRSAILAFLKVRGKRFNAAKLTGSRQVTTPTLQSHTDVEACPNNHQHLPYPSPFLHGSTECVRIHSGWRAYWWLGTAVQEQKAAEGGHYCSLTCGLIIARLEMIIIKAERMSSAFGPSVASYDSAADELKFATVNKQHIYPVQLLIYKQIL